MAEDTKYETVLAVGADENIELSEVADEESRRQDSGQAVSENSVRPVAVQIEDIDQDHHKGQSRKEILTSKCTQKENEPEDQEQNVRDEDADTENGKGDSDSSSGSSDADSDSSDGFWAQMYWREADDEEKQTKQTNQEKRRKEELFTAIEQAEFPIVQGMLTAKTIMSCGSNPLLVAINATEKLLARVNKKEPDKAGFKDLANRVEEFTLRFMDPLQYYFRQRDNSGLKDIVETAIKLKQKKFFDHPVILHVMAEMWYGDYLESSRPWWLFLSVWCLFDVVLFPISLFAAFVLSNVINQLVNTIGQYHTC